MPDSDGAVRRYPLQTLEDIVRPEIESRFGTFGPAQLAHRLGLGEKSGRQQIYHMREKGLSHRQADRFAVRVGRLPWTIWPNWLEGAGDQEITDEQFWSDTEAESLPTKSRSGVSTTAILDWLRDNPGDHTVAQIAEALDSPAGPYAMTSKLASLVRNGLVEVTEGRSPKTYSLLLSGISRTALLDVLRTNGRMTVAQLAKQLGESLEDVEKALGLAEKAHQVQRDKSSWKLAVKGVRWTKHVLVWLQEHPGAHTAAAIAEGVGATSASAVTAGLSSLVKSGRVLLSQDGNSNRYSASGLPDDDGDDGRVRSRWAGPIVEWMKGNPGAHTAGDIASGVKASGASAVTAGLAALVKAGMVQRAGQIRGKSSYQLVTQEELARAVG